MMNALLAPSRKQKTFSTAAGLVIVCLSTFLADRFQLNLASTVLLQLLVVVVLAFRAGFWPATIVSVVANVNVLYFIVPPAFSFTIADPQNWVSLAAFEFTALVVSRLSTTAQFQAARAENRQAEIERLYEFSRELLLLDAHQRPGDQIVLLIKRQFGVSAVALYDSGSDDVAKTGDCDDAFERFTRSAASLGETPQAVLEFSLVQTIGGTRKGALGIRGRQITQMTLRASASLTSIALERAWSMENESRAEAKRQSEQLRTAVLDALAHEYKTPLTTIRTASSTFLAMQERRGLEKELLSLIDNETDKLDRLTTRLLQTSRLGGVEVHLSLEPVEAGDIIRDVIAGLKDQLRGRSIRIDGQENRLNLNVDRELIAMALSQLVDNAAKYSDPSTIIRLTVVGPPQGHCISVHSTGPAIPADQLERIFDRFYRSPQLQHRAGGTGLGLSVTRRIMEAHGGEVGVQSEAGGNTFFLSLPMPDAASVPDKPAIHWEDSQPGFFRESAAC